MNLSDVWNAATYNRNDEEEIVSVEVPIEMWRFLMDYVQQMEDKLAARDRLAKLRQSQSTNQNTRE